MLRIFESYYRAKCKHRGIQRLLSKRIRAITTLIKSRINNINNNNNNNSPSFLSFMISMRNGVCYSQLFGIQIINDDDDDVDEHTMVS